jgi:hypothetical protein
VQAFSSAITSCSRLSRAVDNPVDSIRQPLCIRLVGWFRTWKVSTYGVGAASQRALIIPKVHAATANLVGRWLLAAFDFIGGSSEDVREQNVRISSKERS